MTQHQESELATASAIDSEIDNVCIVNWGDFTRWCLYGNPATVTTAVQVTTAKAGWYTDHFTTWSIEPDGAGYVEIKHDHTGSYATATGTATDALVQVKPRRGNIDQKWRVQRHGSGRDSYLTLNPKVNEDLSAAAGSPFSPPWYGNLVLRARARNEWPCYQFVLLPPEQQNVA